MYKGHLVGRRAGGLLLVGVDQRFVSILILGCFYTCGFEESNEVLHRQGLFLAGTLYLFEDSLDSLSCSQVAE